MEQVIEQLSTTTTLFYSRVYKRLLIKKKSDKYANELFVRLRLLENVQIPSIIEMQDEYIYFEYIEGENLREYLETYSEMLDINRFMQHVLATICMTLKSLHVNNIVHKDIKPENIIVTNKQEIFLIDFGTSRLLDEHKTQDTHLFGTRGYASPEHFGFQETDNRSDIYSLGVLLAEYVTQKELLAIADKCRALDPSNRFQDVAEILKLMGYKTITGGASIPEKSLKRKMSIAEIIALIAASVVFIVIILALFWTPKTPNINSPIIEHIAVVVFASGLAIIPAVVILVVSTIIESVKEKKVSGKYGKSLKYYLINFGVDVLLFIILVITDTFLD